MISGIALQTKSAKVERATDFINFYIEMIIKPHFEILYNILKTNKHMDRQKNITTYIEPKKNKI